MLVTPYASHVHACNKVTHGSLPLLTSDISYAFITILEHCLTKNENKPPWLHNNKKSISYHEDNMPIVFLKSGDTLQQHPNLGYHQDEPASFQGTSHNDLPIKPWSMDIPAIYLPI